MKRSAKIRAAIEYHDGLGRGEMCRVIVPVGKVKVRPSPRTRQRQMELEEALLTPTEKILRRLDQSLSSFDHALACLEKSLGMLE